MQVNGGVTDNSIYGVSGQKIAVNNKQDFASLKEAQDAAKDHKGNEAILRNEDGSYSIYNIADDPKSEKQAIEMAKKGNVADFNPNIVEFSLSGFIWDTSVKIENTKGEKDFLSEVGSEIKGSSLEGSKTGKNLFNSESEAIEAAKLHTGIEAVIKTDDGKFKLYRATEQDIDKIKDNPNYKGKVTAFVVPTSITLPFMYTPITFDNVIKIPVVTSQPTQTNTETQANSTETANTNTPSSVNSTTDLTSVNTPSLVNNSNFNNGNNDSGLSLPHINPVSLKPISQDFNLIGDLYDPLSFDIISFPDTNLKPPSLGLNSDTINMPETPSLRLGENFSSKIPYPNLTDNNYLGFGLDYNFYNDLDLDFSSKYKTSSQENKQNIEKSVNEISKTANDLIKNESQDFRNVFDNKQITIDSFPASSKSLLIKSDISGTAADNELKSALVAFKKGDSLNARQLLLISGAADQMAKDPSVSPEIKEKLNNLSNIGTNLSTEVIKYNETQKAADTKFNETKNKISSEFIKTEIDQTIMSIVDKSSPSKAKEDLGKMQEILSDTKTTLKEKSELLSSLGIKTLSQSEISQDLLDNTSSIINKLLIDLDKKDNGRTAQLRAKSNFLEIDNFDEKDNSVNVNNITLKLKDKSTGFSELKDKKLGSINSNINNELGKINNSIKTNDSDFKNIFNNSQISMDAMSPAVKVLLDKNGISGSDAEKELNTALETFKNGGDLTANQLLLISGASEQLLSKGGLDEANKAKLEKLALDGKALTASMGQIIDINHVYQGLQASIVGLQNSLPADDIARDSLVSAAQSAHNAQDALNRGDRVAFHNQSLISMVAKDVAQSTLTDNYDENIRKLDRASTVLSNNSLSVEDKVTELVRIGYTGLENIDKSQINATTLNTVNDQIQNTTNTIRRAGRAKVNQQRDNRRNNPQIRAAMNKFTESSDLLTKKFNSKDIFKNMEFFFKAVSSMKTTIDPTQDMFTSASSDYAEDQQMTLDDQIEEEIKSHEDRASELEAQLGEIDNIDVSGSNIISLLRKFREIIVTLDMDTSSLKKSVSGKTSIDRRFSDMLKENRSRWNQLDEIRKEYQTHFQSSKEVQGAILPDSFKNNFSNLSKDLSRNIQMFRELNN